MAQGIAAAGGPGVVAGEEHRTKVPGVQPAHHTEGVSRPAPHDVDALGQRGGIQVPGGVMGVLDEDLAVLFSGEHSVAGGPDFPGHLFLEGDIVPGGGALGLRPVGDAAGALDVGADKYIHGDPSLIDGSVALL